MADNISGNVTGKIRFNIDKKSWDNLTQFQQKLTNVKRQLSGLSGDLKVNVVVNSINKVANATVAAEKKIAEAKVATAKKVQKANNASGSHPTLARVNNITGVSTAGGTLDPRSKQRLSDISWWERQLKSLEAQQNKVISKQKTVNQVMTKKDPVNVMYSSSQKATGYKDLNYAIMFENLLKERDANKAKADRDKARSDKQTTKSEGLKERNTVRADSYLLRKELQIRSYGVMRNKGNGWIEEEIGKLREVSRAARNKHGLDTAEGYTKFKDAITESTKGLLDQQRAAHRNAITFASMRKELVQLTAAYSAFNALVSTGQVGMEWESLQASAKVFARDDAGVADHMSYIREEADRLGVDLKTAAKEFTKFSIATQTNMSKAEQRNLFTGISEYAAVLGTSQSDYERAFRAVQQIASKGQLTI